MKRISVTSILPVFLCLPYLQRAQNAIAYDVPALNVQEQQRVDKKLQSLKPGTQYYLVRLDPDAFLKSEVLVNFPPGTVEKMHLQSMTRYNDRDYSIRGGMDQINYYSLTNVNGRISGHIRIKSKAWYIYTIGNNTQLLYPESSRSIGCGPIPENSSHPLPKPYIQDINRSMKTAQFLTANCRVRLLVMFTTNAYADAMNDIMSEINASVDYFNMTNANSEVYFQVELARAVRTPYEESNEEGPAPYNRPVDLIRFHDPEDGYMDIADNYRDAYDADMCILLVDSLYDSWAGYAWTIGADDDDDAFAVAVYDGQRTFTHELGHLFGCKHDTYTLTHTAECNDLPLVVPTGCSHGYVNLTEGNEFVTIMSYDRECDCTEVTCSFAPHWSNPNVTWNGEPTGTACDNPLARENNAQKLNDDYDIQASHRPYVPHKAWDYTGELQNEVIQVGEYGDLIGKFTLNVAANTSTTYSVNSGGEARFRAGQKITFHPGFSARSGCIANAILESCEDISNLTSDTPVLTREFYHEQTGEPEFSVRAEIDSVNAKINITCIIGTDASARLDLRDMDGNLLLPILPGESISCGRYELVRDISHLGTGPFELHLEAKTGRHSKVVKEYCGK